MRLLGWILIVLAFVAIAVAGNALVRDGGELRAQGTRISELAAQRDSLTEQLRNTSLEYRGYQQSIPTIPDSIRLETSAELAAKSRYYTKTIRTLQFQKKQAAGLVLRQERLHDEARGRLNKELLTLGAPGVLSLLFGIVLVWRSRNRL